MHSSAHVAEPPLYDIVYPEGSPDAGDFSEYKGHRLNELVQMSHYTDDEVDAVARLNVGESVEVRRSEELLWSVLRSR